MNAPSTRRQLFRLSRNDFVAPNYVDVDGTLHTRPACDLPLIVWPDGRWCYEANRFIRERFEANLSRRNRGGTLAIEASQLAHLLHYCASEGLVLAELTDSQFRGFITKLGEARLPTGRKLRNSNTTTRIGRTCLALLHSLAIHDGDDGRIGPTGTIRATKRTYIVRTQGPFREGKPVNYWHHEIFPEPDTLRRRHPISTASIDKLKQAVGVLSATSHQRMRRHVLLRLFEVLGARRSEVALLRVEDIQAASKMKWPMLKVRTLKRRSEDRHRFVPISHVDLRFVMQYVEVHRRSVIRRHLVGADHGFLLVAGTTGRALTSSTLTGEMRRLAHAAGLQEQSCAHMFRHRFITKAFVRLIQEHEVSNPDDFRKRLLDVEAFKRKVMEWTDQASLASLDWYIDLAFEDLSNLTQTYDRIRVSNAVEAFIASLKVEFDGSADCRNPRSRNNRLQSLAQSLMQEIQASSVGPPSPCEASR